MQAPPPPAQAPIAVGARTAPTATEMYEAAKLAQREVRNQLDELQGERSQLQSQLKRTTNQADLKGVEGRLAAVDARIADVAKQLASADAMVANRAAIPGVVVQVPTYNHDIPPGVMVISGLGMLMVVLIPLSIAYARRIWRRTANARTALPSDLSARMESIERGIEAVAIEVERVGEGQRFVTQLLDAQGRRQLSAEVRRSGQDA